MHAQAGPLFLDELKFYDASVPNEGIRDLYNKGENNILDFNTLYYLQMVKMIGMNNKG